MNADPAQQSAQILQQRVGLIVGIANSQSIAWGCARAMHDAGASLAVTYLNDKALPHVAPLAEAVAAPLLLPLDVRDEAQTEAVFEAIRATWGRLDFLVHSIAFAPLEDLHGRVTDCSRDGFLTAMDISCHSFVRLARRAEPLMTNGGSLVTMSYYGAEKAVPDYNLMGPVKAALEASVRYMAHELGGSGIRVNAVSPGPIRTRAASGLSGFDQLVARAEHDSPFHDLVSIDDVGQATAFLCSPFADRITGQTLYIDGGVSVRG